MTNISNNKTGEKRRIIEYLFMLILFLYPLRNAFIGIDIMDAGYTLGNYRFFEIMEPTWKFATYLANVVGRLFSMLPFGRYWYGMNIYCSLLISVTSVSVFAFLSKRYKYRGLLLFVVELVVISLCWAPAVNLYQYLGYYLMTFAAMTIYKAITESNKKLYVVAGILLGISVMVRMPNVTYMALIIPVWYAAWKNEKKGKRLQKAFVDTMYCILGYIVGIIIPFGYICFKYGLQSYINMIHGLFGMTEKATDYTPMSMLTASWKDCFTYGAWLWLFVAYIFVGIILFKILNRKYEVFKKIIYIAGFLVLLRLCYGRGMFGIHFEDYTNYFSIYKWTNVFLLLTVITCVYQIVGRHTEYENKLWAVIILTMCFITPLGSNNGIFPTVNNMFLIAPVSVMLIKDMVNFINCMLERISIPAFPVRSVECGILICIMIQSLIFGVIFTFHDEKIKDQARVKASIEGSVSTQGMYTSVDNNNDLNELGGYLTKNNLTDKKVILFGNIPGVAYIFDLEPAIFTTWPDLDSKTIQLMDADLLTVDTDNTIIIMSKEKITTNEMVVDKREHIEMFIDENNYMCDFENNKFLVYVK